MALHVRHQPRRPGCQQFVERVTEYLEDGLPAAERERCEAHLARCSGCRTCLEQMRLTIRWLGRLSDTTIEPEAKQRLLAAFRDWRAGESVAGFVPSQPKVLGNRID